MTDIFQRIEGSWSHIDHVRHFFYEDVFKTIQEHIKWEPDTYTLLEFGAREPTTAIIRMIKYSMRDTLATLIPYVSDYPQDDIQNLTRWHDGGVDIAVADQVLEHVERPWVAAEELYRITRQGGLCIVATPFIMPIHNCPLDCWRIAPDGYKVLFPKDKWQWLKLGMWGDRDKSTWEMQSPITRGLTGDWLTVKEAERTMPCYNDQTDGLLPMVIWWLGIKL